MMHAAVMQDAQLLQR